MPSKIRRRSGNAFVEYMKLIDWEPSHVVMAGLGSNHEEVHVMRETWKDFELYAFEAHPEIYNGAKASFPGVIYNEGLWSEPCLKTLHVKPKWKDGSSFFESNQDQEQRNQVQVKCTTLDDWFALFKNPFENNGCLWIDVEGSEQEVLKSASAFMQTVEAVNVEMTCVGRGNDWCSPGDVHYLLDSYGFRQMFVHTIRPCIGQYDAIYVKESVYNSELSHCR